MCLKHVELKFQGGRLRGDLSQSGTLTFWPLKLMALRHLCLAQGRLFGTGEGRQDGSLLFHFKLWEVKLRLSFALSPTKATPQQRLPLGSPISSSRYIALTFRSWCSWVLTRCPTRTWPSGRRQPLINFWHFSGNGNWWINFGFLKKNNVLCLGRGSLVVSKQGLSWGPKLTLNDLCSLYLFRAHDFYKGNDQ